MSSIARSDLDSEWSDARHLRWKVLPREELETKDEILQHLEVAVVDLAGMRPLPVHKLSSVPGRGSISPDRDRVHGADTKATTPLK
jgi:hypothetical protein